MLIFSLTKCVARATTVRHAALRTSPRPRAPCTAIKGAAEVVAVAKGKGAAIKGAAA